MNNIHTDNIEDTSTGWRPRLRVWLYAVITLGLLSAAIATSAQTVDIMPDTWAATDAIGRVMPEADTSPLRTDKTRTVGIFYVTWHDEGKFSSMTAPYSADVTKILEKDYEARLDGNHPLWKDPQCHWGEPEMGYFLSRDEWVIRRDMSMLADAGVDVLILDCTNGVCYFDEWNTLFATMSAMKAEGNAVPKMCFWVYNGNPVGCAQQIYDTYYKPGRYSDLWFYWEGKPLFLYNADPTADATGSGHQTAGYSSEVKNFFTLRNMWWGYYQWKGERYVGTEDNWSFGYDLHHPPCAALTPAERAATHRGRYEQMCVTPAQHSSTMVGKSWTLAEGEPKLDHRDLPLPIFGKGARKLITDVAGLGIYFQDRWDEALGVDPDFIYLNDWNEWTAGKFAQNCSFMGRSSNFQFVDQYNAEFNRTIQPMKGGYTDNYYMQMVQNIRRYKGVRPSPVATYAHTAVVDGRFDDWEAVGEEYLDTRGDVDHRDHNGYGGLHYTDDSGRNDIVRSKVAMDAGAVYFYVETAAPLTRNTDPGWMLLLVDADDDTSTGWCGYDFIVNYHIPYPDRSAVMAWDAESKKWIPAGYVALGVSGCRMELALPRTLLGEAACRPEGSILFKWVDNPSGLDNMIDLCTAGDTAPNRRFNYRYSWSGNSAVPVAVDTVDVPIKAEGVSGGIAISGDGRYSVADTCGRQVASGMCRGQVFIDIQTPGFYIVSAGGTTDKIVVK